MRKTGDLVDRTQKQRIERIHSRSRYQQKPEPMSEAEKLLLEEERKRLEQLEKERDQKEQMYRSRR